MLFAIDTSTLIILQKLGWLSLCDKTEYDVVWPAMVTQELKRQKSRNKAVLDLLNSGKAKERTIQRSREIKDIVSVISLASFCVLLYQSDLSSKAECLSRLKTLHETTALSKSEYHQYLQGLLP